MTTLIRSALLLAIFCWPLIAFPQEVPPLAIKLERVLEEKEPKWKIDRPYRQMSPPVMHLKSGEGDILIYFFLADTERSAQDIFEGGIIAFGNILGPRKKEIKLPNLGDDNRLISDRSGRFTEVSFRKGKTCIKVMAPSEAIAKRFAQYAMDQILEQERAG